MINKPELQERIQAALPFMQDDDFDYYATDLYVRARPGVVQWLVRNYEFWTNVTRFTCPVSDPELQEIGVRELWLDVPFAGYWLNDRKTNEEKVRNHEHN